MTSPEFTKKSGSSFGNRIKALHAAASQIDAVALPCCIARPDELDIFRFAGSGLELTRNRCADRLSVIQVLKADAVRSNARRG